MWNFSNFDRIAYCVATRIAIRRTVLPTDNLGELTFKYESECDFYLCGGKVQRSIYYGTSSG
jgi:hypothetical protein